jgi:cytochrome c oxidase subunit IV
MMQFQSNRFSTQIWAILVALTVVTFGIGEAGLAGRGVMLTLLAISFVKGQMVANYFMGLRHAGWLWRGIILGYFLVVGGMIAIAYLIGLRT